MWLDVSISLMGAAVSGCILAVLWNIPPGQRSARLRPWWLLTWGSMCLHFLLQSLSASGIAGLDAAAGLLLAIAIWALVDGVVGSGARPLHWAMRGAGLLTMFWVVFVPNWSPHGLPQISVYSAFGVELVVGSLAVRQLRGTSRMTRRVLALGLLGWGVGMTLPFRSEAAVLFINVETLICKTICGLALVLFVVDEQRNLAESHRDYLNDLYHKSPVWYHTAGLDGTILDINQVALDILGADREAIVHHCRLADLCTAESARKLPPFGDFVSPPDSGTKPVALDLDLVAKGKTRAMRCYLRPVFEADLGAPVIRCVLLDVTHEKELQQQLVEAQKLKALGTLTAGLAHDFNNILSAQLGQLELIALQFHGQLPGDVSSRLDMVRRSGQLAANLVAQLLTFARRGPRQMGPVNLWETVAEIEALLRHSFPANIKIRISCDGSDCVIWGNASQLQQALLNLAVNAQQAMSAGGVLDLVLHHCESLPAALASELEDNDPRAWICIRVTDTGEGMSDAVRKQIFEPFFTTRTHGHGTGLGLATVYGIVEAHQGKIYVESSHGQGTTFSLYLPAAAGMVVPAPRLDVPESAPFRPCRVLLVEDECSVADVTAQLLATLGHTVITRALPQQALDWMETAEIPVDLLITDLTMPEMNGYELVERVRRSWPRLPVLLVSGYDLQGDAPAGTATLAKPLTLNSLRRGVEQAINAMEKISARSAGS